MKTGARGIAGCSRLVQLGLRDQSLANQLRDPAEFPLVTLVHGARRDDSRASLLDYLDALATLQFYQTLLRLGDLRLSLRGLRTGHFSFQVHENLTDRHVLALAHIQRDDRLGLFRDELNTVPLEGADQAPVGVTAAAACEPTGEQSDRGSEDAPIH